MEQTIEIKRLENLHKYGILDTPSDGDFDEITSLAAKIFNVPVAIITLVDTDRIWFKSSYGPWFMQFGNNVRRNLYC